MHANQVRALWDRGFSIIPLKGKLPALASWKAYQSKRPTVEEIDHWFREGGNVGIITGAVSGVVVLDVDAAQAPTGLLPKTPTVKTRRGHHYYFRHPGHDVRGKIGLRKDIDLRADGNYVVAPPSIHPDDGTLYEWIEGLDTPFADIPDWVLKPANDNELATAYGRTWFRDVEELANASAGSRNDLLNTVACKAGSLISSGNLSEREARSAMINACGINRLIIDDGLASVHATIASGLSKGQQNPRYPLDPLKTEAVHRGGKLVILKASDIKEEKPDWLWKGVLAKRSLSILAGDQGLGKSQVTCSLAATVSSGGEWPVSKERAEQGTVLLFSMEDSPEYTIRPRLRAAGADLDRVQIVKMTVDDKGQRPVSLKADMPEIRAAVQDIGDVALIIIDPLTAYLGAANNNDVGDVRGITTELSALAQDHGLCVLGVSHLNKKADQQAAYRVAGSGAWTQAARTVFLIERDGDGPDKRSMTPLKNNLAPDTSGFAFAVQSVTLDESGIDTSKVVWQDFALNKTAAQALNEKAEDSGGALGEAKDFLLALLTAGPVPSRKVLDAAEESGIAEKTLQRAKKALGCESLQHEGMWCWSLPLRR